VQSTAVIDCRQLASALPGSLALVWTAGRNRAAAAHTSDKRREHWLCSDPTEMNEEAFVSIRQP
jgi:hypothetical protein